MSKVTIEDISRQTGLSRGTVSRALNSRPDISEQTKNRVLEACRQLNYVPSHAARSLATGRSYAATVVVDDLTHAYAVAFVRGVMLRAMAEHYTVHVCETGVNDAELSAHLRSVAQERVDCAIFAVPTNHELVRKVAESLGKRPLLAADMPAGLTGDTFAPDEAEGGRLVGRHILRTGQRDVLYFDAGGPGAAARRSGFEDICRERQIDPAAIIVDVSGPGIDRQRMIGERLNGLRAIAASDDMLAIEALLAATQNGRRSGQDIAIVGQGNETIAARLGLTSVDFSGEETGQRAMDIALQRVGKARQDGPQTVRVTPTLQVRESSRNLGA